MRSLLLVLLLALLLLISLAAVEAFSAHLARPWEAPVSSNHHKHNNKNKNNNGGFTTRLYVASELDKPSDDNKTEETTKNQNKEDEEEKEGEDEDDDGQLEDEAEGNEIPESASHILDSSSRSSSTVLTTNNDDGHGHGHGHGNGNGHSPQQQQDLHHEPSMVPAAAVLSPTPEPLVKNYLPDLIAMTRPSNLPGVVLFHMLGVFLVVPPTVNYWKFLMHPSMCVTLLALLLTSSTSMLVNDYYDFKLGNDAAKIYKPIHHFWYTQHLKPRTWLKNAVCASLIALSPLTSGVAAISLLGATQPLLSSPYYYLLKSLKPLIRVVTMLYVGILGREMTMDINDVEEDQRYGVRTVPVVYGKKFASRVALTCSVAMSTLALSSPFLQMLLIHHHRGNANYYITKAMIRRLVLATLGSVAQLRRAWQVFATEGQDPAIVSKSVEEGLMTVVLLLASFV